MPYKPALYRQTNNCYNRANPTIRNLHVRRQRAAEEMLLFKKKFLLAIRQGRKTQTIRLWKHRMMRAGQRSYIPGVGYIQITSVDKVDLESLSDEDARPDGFETADELRAELARLYPEQIDAGYCAYRVVFRLIDEEPPE